MQSVPGKDSVCVCACCCPIIPIHVFYASVCVCGQGVLRHRHVNPCKVEAGIIKPIA